MRTKIITQTERLILRPFDMSDVEAMCRVLCDPEVMLFSGGVEFPEGVRGWIKACIGNYSCLGFGHWAMVEKSAKGAMGYCGLTQFPDIDGQPEIEIGFRLARSFWYRGYATEAAVAVRDYAFHTLYLPRLIALIDPENTASIRVVDKIGMRYERDVMLSGYDYPDRLYTIRQSNEKQTEKKKHNTINRAT